MKQEAWKVFFSCALGAGIGTLVALEMTVYLWWIGLIVGGLVGYLSYKPMKIARAIPPAIKQVSGKVYASLVDVIETSRKPYFWGILGYLTLVFLFIGFWGCVFVDLMLLFIAGASASADFSGLMLSMIGCMTLMGAGMGLSLSCTAHTDNRERLMKNHRDFAFHLAPPVVIFYHSPRGIWWIMRHGVLRLVVWTVRCAREGAWFCLSVVWEVFLRIHSEKRMLCLIDAAIGTGVGFGIGFLTSVPFAALAGALAGGIWGLVNYELITKRWLEPAGHLPLDPS